MGHVLNGSDDPGARKRCQKLWGTLIFSEYIEDTISNFGTKQVSEQATRVLQREKNCQIAVFSKHAFVGNV